MRRKDRELKDMADIVSIAKRENVCTVAFHDESCPYLIPLNYGAEVFPLCVPLKLIDSVRAYHQ